MLEFLRRSASSVFAWIILGVLALVFGLSFGLPSDSLTFGNAPLVKVDGQDITDTDFRYQYALTSRVIPMPKDERMMELMGVREEMLDAAVERTLLAKLARAMGLEATKWDAETLTLNGQFIVLGDTYDWLGDAEFNYDLFKDGWLRALRVPEHKYLAYQADEILARTVRDTITAAAVVPPEQVRAAYEREANRLSLRYVRFEAAAYADLVDPTDEEIQRHLEAQRDALKEQLGKQALRFTRLPKQLRMYIIELPKSEPDAAKKLAKARARILAGEDFRAVARELSKHPSARRGGDYGWVSEGGTGSGLDPEVDRAASELETGALSGVVSGDEALYLVWTRARREGDVPEDQALAELAEEALRDKRGKDLARQAAEEALLAVKGGKALDDLFTPPPALDPGTAQPIEELASPSPSSGPALQTTGLFPRDKPIPGLGPQPELARAAWEAPADTPVLDQVFELAGGYVLAGIERKEAATDEGFAAERPRIARQLARDKAERILSHFAMRSCLEEKGKGRIVPSPDRIARLMTYDSKIGVDEEGKRVTRPYSVCDRVGMRGGLLRTGMLARQGAQGS